ncbi:alpha/beta hydrolase [Saccharopolyspora sp. TS4A08]|uniref:Alpha/beta hydrolase n=1 Tax=Saccharopolyspora ipomoeae TaxID=3042027 RepID=A0ABT6PQR1_9PSEU|nr:alpha/beta hydrolase [Saccharopolyspora sp. TS4A08]MDI2030349.1 alpha/beta hydrolase [Saccharopolyspora sp. TS4A08]
MPERTLSCNGVDLHVVEQGSGPPVIFSHGFPELAYSWRHQLPALARAGYRAVAPDQRGYGRSSRPESIADYDIEHLSGDLIALLDELGEEKAVFVGHDWGSMVVWQTALLHPERVAGVCGMSVPFTPRPPVPPTEAFRARYGKNFFYILYFQEPGVADAELNARPAETMRRMLAGTRVEPDRPGGMDVADDGRGFVDRFPEMTELPSWLSQDELDFYIGEFTRTGFTGGLNWYRNFDRSWERTPQLAGAKVEVPSFFIGGTADPVIAMTPPSIQEPWLSDSRGSVLVEGAGHWVQQEAPEEVNTAILGFLDSIGYRENA